MRRLLVSFIIGIALLIPAFSETCYFSPYPAAFNVNLKDSTTYGGALNSGNIDQDGKGGLAYWQRASYNDNTIIAVSGVTNISNDERANYTYSMEVSVQLHGDGWNYVSASEPYLERPFAIDVIMCNQNNANTTREFVRMGAGGTTSNTITVDLEPAYYENRNDLSEAWVDIVLYLPELTSGDTSALSADDYYAGLNVKIYREKNKSSESTDGSTEESYLLGDYSFTFNGYIDEEPDFTDAHIFFNVTPNANANSMDVRQLLLENASYDVGTYSYETQAFLTGGQTSGGNDKLKYVYQAGNDYYIFASANDVPTSPNTAGFRMYYNGDTTAESFPFIVGLDTATDNTESNTGRVIWFDGTDDLTTLDKSDPPKKIQATRVEEDFGFKQGSGQTLYFRDNGTIWIDYDENSIEGEEEFVTSLSPGVYSTRIYFHIVSTK